MHTKFRRVSKSLVALLALERTLARVHPVVLCEVTLGLVPLLAQLTGKSLILVLVHHALRHSWSVGGRERNVGGSIVASWSWGAMVQNANASWTTHGVAKEWRMVRSKRKACVVVAQVIRVRSSRRRRELRMSLWVGCVRRVHKPAPRVVLLLQRHDRSERSHHAAERSGVRWMVGHRLAVNSQQLVVRGLWVGCPRHYFSHNDVALLPWINMRVFILVLFPRVEFEAVVLVEGPFGGAHHRAQNRWGRWASGVDFWCDRHPMANQPPDSGAAVLSTLKVFVEKLSEFEAILFQGSMCSWRDGGRG